MGCDGAVWGPGTPGSPRAEPLHPQVQRTEAPLAPEGEGLRAGPSAQRGGRVCTAAPRSGLAQPPALCWGPQGPRKALSEVDAEGTWGV